MPLFSWLSRIKKYLPCQLCGVDQQYIHSVCKDCWQDLPWKLESIQRHQHTILVACDYQFPIDRVIQKFKYNQQLQYQYLLAGCLSRLALPQIDALVPMPISRKRLVERGYNQMLLIANILAKQHRLPIWQPIIRSQQHAQKGLSRVERIQGIEQQFHPKPKLKQHYARVLILDDVITTGSSNAALVAQLKAMGCTEVYSACISAAHH